MKKVEEMKVGDVEEYHLDEKTLVLEPIPYGRLKKLIKYVTEGMAEFGESAKLSQEEFVKTLPALFEKHAGNILPLLFNPKTHTFINQEWIDENITIPILTDIVKKAIIINGLSDFFAKAKNPLAQNPVEMRPLAEQQVVTKTHGEMVSMSSGSTTSSL